MPKKTTHLQLPFEFDTKKLLSDLSLVVNNNWVSHFNTNGYNGDWKAIPLYAEQGDESNIFALYNSNIILTETPVLKECHYFREVIQMFKCKVLSARILKLGIGAEIKPHRDHELGYEDHNFRLHIPITTNKGVQFILDDTLLKMLPGECWYTNVNFVHSVKNLGTTDRVHLVLDFERNDWSDTLFFSLAPEESFQFDTSENHSKETILSMIEELKLNNEPAAKILIKELELKLNQNF